jgi:hypothetical protein
MIKNDFDQNKLKQQGYTFSVMEGGYISKDGATIVNIFRSPYERQVHQFRPDSESEHNANVEKLKEIDALE